MRSRPGALCAVMLLFGCAMAQESVPPDPIIGPTWRVESMDGRATLPEPAATLMLTPEGHVLGSASCNRFTGGYRLEAGDRLSFGQVASTRRLCPPSIQAQENRFLHLLGTTDRYHLDETGRILLLSPDGGSVTLAREVATERTVRFACENGGALTVTFTGDAARVGYGGDRPALLRQQLAASGFRYAGDGHELRGKGDEVAWTVAGGEPTRCRVR